MKIFLLKYSFKIIIVIFICMLEILARTKEKNYPLKADEVEKNKAKLKVGIFENLKILKEVFFDSESRVPKDRLPEIKPNLSSFTKKSKKTKFIWLGHSTVLINIDSQIILTDPVFSKNASPVSFIAKRFQPSALNLKELSDIDTVIISHNHYDHLDKKTIKFFKDKSTNFIVPLGVGDILCRWGIDSLRITELNWYESTKKKSITYTATPAKHFSGRSLFDRNKTLWSSWVVEGECESLFFSGDSGYGKHFKEIMKKFREFDIAFIENGQYDKKWPDVHMMPEETIQAAMDLNAKAFVPIHWGMFSISFHDWSDPIEKSYEFGKKRKLSIIAPKLGEIADIEFENQFPLWWEIIKK